MNGCGCVRDSSRIPQRVYTREKEDRRKRGRGGEREEEDAFTGSCGKIAAASINRSCGNRNVLSIGNRASYDAR
jgi:hypothetical protein